MKTSLFVAFAAWLAVASGHQWTHDQRRWFHQYGMVYPDDQLQVTANSSDVMARVHDLNNALDSLSTLLDQVHGNPDKLAVFADRLARVVREIPTSVQTGDLDADDFARCANGIGTWLGKLLQFDLAAWQIADAWATKQGGLLEGNVRWPGHYYQCEAAVSGKPDNGTMLRGKWCQAFYGFKYEPVVIGIPIDVAFGTCFPDTCSDQMIRWLLEQLLGDATDLPLLHVDCPDLDTSLGTGEIVAISVTSVLLGLVAIGTIVDVIGRQSGDDRPSSLASRMCVCFSLVSNIEKIVSTRRPAGLIPALDGIRVFSTFWVILGHSYYYSLSNIDNVVRAGEDARKGSYLAVYNATYAVDTFFLLSGLLVSYLTLKHLARNKGKINVPLMYLQRYLRLTPVYAYFILFLVGLYKYVGSGPYWEAVVNRGVAQCNESWWANLVYINNLYPVYPTCLGHGWYLASDMQYYLLAPLFIYLLYRFYRFGVSFLTVILVASMATAGQLSYDSKQQPNAIGNMFGFSFWYRFYVNSTAEVSYEYRLQSDIYYVPWTRIGAYLVGILAGHLLFVSNGKLKMHQAVVWIGWLISISSGVAIVYGLVNFTSTGKSFSDLHVAAFYSAFTRPAWAVCVGWVVIACSSGYGGPINSILNWKAFMPLSRLTYGAYLVHPLVLYWHSGTRERPMHYSTLEQVYIYLATLVLSFGVSFITCLLVEWPVQELMRIAFPRSKSPRSGRENGADQNVVAEAAGNEQNAEGTWGNKQNGHAGPAANGGVVEKVDLGSLPSYDSVNHDDSGYHDNAAFQTDAKVDLSEKVITVL